MFLLQVDPGCPGKDGNWKRTFPGQYGSAFHGTTPTIREVAYEGEAQSSANEIEAGEHEEGAPDGHSKEQSGVHPGCHFCPWSGSSSLREALQKAKDMSGKPENPRQEAGKSPNERVEGRTIGGALQLLGVDSPDAEPIKVALETARGQCRVLPVGERLDSCLKFVEQAAQELLAKFESQVAQGLADLERLRAEARVTPVATARPEEEVGNNIEELAALRREVDQLRRERDVWLGKSNPSQSMDTSTPGIHESRSSRMATAFHNRQLCVVRKRISMHGLRGVRVGEASNPSPGRAQRRRRVSSSSADAECDPTLLDDLARDLGADVTQRDSSPWSVIPVRSQAVIAVPRPPGTFFSGRFALLADGDQHDDTFVEPIWPTEQDANSKAVDSVRQESDTESVLSEGISEVHRELGGGKAVRS